MEDNNRVGIIFQLPFSNHNRFGCLTFNTILSEPNVLFRILTDRISLATALALTLSRFHLAQWVHKSFSSHNIILFRDVTSRMNVQPGFWLEFSLRRWVRAGMRQTAVSDPRYNRPVEWTYRAYVHPERLTDDFSPQSSIRFKKPHDNYGLCVVLLEIALGRPVTSLKFCQNQDPSKNLDVLSPLDLLGQYRSKATKISIRMGDIYSEVTVRREISR